MRIDPQVADTAVLAELGSRLAHLRLEQELQQSQLAAEAGIGIATLQRLEAGQDVRLTTVVRVLRALGRLGALDLLVPESGPSPLELLKLNGRQRQRVRSSPLTGEAPSSGLWRWGDERRAGTEG